jgi:hypothetical protein
VAAGEREKGEKGPRARAGDRALMRPADTASAAVIR